MRITLLACLAMPLVRGFTPFQQPKTTPTHDRVPADAAAPTSSPWKEVKSVVATGVLGSLLFSATAALAVSGGGLDYANLDLSGQDFSNGDYKGKDFTQVIAKGTNFHKSNLQGSRFFKAFLVNADFSGADVRGASFEDTSLDGVSLKGADARGAYFSASILDVEDFENADLTDTMWPSKLQIMLCDRTDLKGTNPVTGADTRASILCN